MLYHGTGKAILDKITIAVFVIADYHVFWSLRVLVIQKVTSKELIWLLIVTMKHKPTSQNYFEKKIADMLNSNL